MLRTPSRFLMCSLIVTLAVPLSIAQQTDPAAPPPWRLSWEERMALRSTVPLREHDPELRPSGLPTPETKFLQLDGAVLPGALVPSEIFMILATMAYSADATTREEMREKILARSTDPELDRRDLWSRLGAAAAPYLALDEQHERVMAEAAAAPEADRGALYAQLPSSDEYCRKQAAALAAARREFGHQAFDRFLYEAVAPDVQIGTAMTPAEIRAMEDGCPDSTPGMP